MDGARTIAGYALLEAEESQANTLDIREYIRTTGSKASRAAGSG